MSSVAPKFRIAICGGGPAGLALAATVARHNDPSTPVAVDLYEAQPELATVGAGISVWPRTRALLEHIGLSKHFQGELGAESAAGPMPGFIYRKSDQTEEGYDIFRLPTPKDPLLLHRTTLLNALKASLPADSLCTVHTSSRLKNYTYADPSTGEGGPVVLHFADGRIASADVVVGADGVRSAVRSSMFPGGRFGTQIVEPKWTGVIAYRSLIKADRLHSTARRATQEPIIVCFSISHVVTYPISRGELVNLVAFVTVPDGYGKEYEGRWVHDVPPDELREQYAGWEPEVSSILQGVEYASAWAIHIMEDVPKSVIGRGVIIGDALHAMETHFGAGAGQAMEASSQLLDAYVLGRLLTHPLTTPSTLDTALSAYERTRLAFATGIVPRTRAVGLRYEFAVGPKPYQPGWEEKWGEEVHALWRWQWEGGPTQLWEEGERALLAGLKVARPRL
ncbi:hypothetical protein OF83DRAFT_1060972 [Amylostereum chailletii]|nr:hypothetical protein OF83DRAFT_1060972 [Amylostereum chailletii]